MSSTSSTLLEELREPNEPAWSRFVELYTPLIFYWARCRGLNAEDAGDLVQDVFVVLLHKLPEFEYDHRKTFRGWLRTVTVNKWRERQRRCRLPMEGKGPDVLEDLPGHEDADEFWEIEYREHLVGRALELVRDEFAPSVWEAFHQYVILDQTAAEVADHLGISVWTVYAAKSRVLRRLRQDLAGLLE